MFQADSLTLIDPGSIVELSWVQSLSGEACGVRFVTEMIAIMPSKTTSVAVEIVLQRLTSLQVSESHKLAPRSIQSGLKYVMGILTDISREEPVDVAAGLSNDISAPIIERMQYFLRRGVGEEAKFGTDVLEEDINNCEAMLANGTTTENDVTNLAVFGWLRPQDKLERVKTILAQYRDKAASSMKSLSKTQQKNRASKDAASSSSRKPKTDKAMEAALSMFK